MNNIIYFILFAIVNVEAKFRQAKIDSLELRCLVCKATIKEFNAAINSIDPSQEVDVGSYRIDSKGNLQQRKVSKAKSEVHLSELASSMCDTMDNYIRASWKDDGSLTILKLIDNGQMSPHFSKIDIIQDDDLNKSLKYYCEEIVEEHEDQIIKYYLEDAKDIAEKICMEHSTYCTPTDFIEREHVEIPGSDDEFMAQLGAANKNFGGMNEGADESSEQLDLDGTDDESSIVDTDQLDDAVKDQLKEEALHDIKEEL